MKGRGGGKGMQEAWASGLTNRWMVLPSGRPSSPQAGARLSAPRFLLTDSHDLEGALSFLGPMALLLPC